MTRGMTFAEAHDPAPRKKDVCACPDCGPVMSKIGTFRGVPQWLCVECGWVSIGEGDARWA